MVVQAEDPEATTKESPPPYEAFDSNHRSHHSHHSIPNYGSQQQPGPATSGKLYREDPRHPTIKFIYCPDPSLDWNSQEWAALLLVKCSDVPRLMRDGLYWDNRNIIHEDGYISRRHSWTRVSALFQRQGADWGGRRHYFLKDLQQPQRWVATIEVYGLHIETLYGFNLIQLSPQKINFAMAFSQRRDDIYEYSYGKPQDRFNAIYDSMPMEGQWPWPRKDTENTPTPEKALALTKEKS